MDRNDVAVAAELSRYLGAAVFPARRPALIKEARQNLAPEHILVALRKLPGEDTYVSPAHVWAALDSAKRHATR